jgi:leucyl aminopeptidase
MVSVDFMEVKSRKSDLDAIQLPLILIGVTKEAGEDDLVEAIKDPLGSLIGDVITLGDFTGKKGETSLIYVREAIPAERVLLVGLGKAEKLTLEGVRKTLGGVSRKVRDLGVGKVGVSLPHIARGTLDEYEAAEAITESFVMGSHQNIHYQTKDLDKYKHIEELVVFSPEADPDRLKASLSSGAIIAEAVNLCRTLSWRPGNYVTPTRLAEEAKRLEEYGVKATVFDREEAEKIGLGSFLAVAQGTEEPPKFIIMEYGAEKKGDTVAIVGKGITFDSGGITLKSGSGMEKMKGDMTGGAVVIAAMEAIARLGVDLHVVGIVPATDNMPSGKALHPGDVVTTYSGQTFEVISTDAEGRMILNDALTYAAKNYEPQAMFDFATLTGSIEVALGNHAIGYFANDDSVAERIEEASKSSGERVWRMPLWEVYDKQLESTVPDFKNTGGRPGGAITAARFLSKFVMDVPWVHMDIAGVDEQKSDEGYNPKGSKGPAVRLIVDVIRNWG